MIEKETARRAAEPKIRNSYGDEDFIGSVQLCHSPLSYRLGLRNADEVRRPACGLACVRPPPARIPADSRPVAAPRRSLWPYRPLDQVVINRSVINFVFAYPLQKSHVIKLAPPGGGKVFTRAGLAAAIATKYQQIYDEEVQPPIAAPVQLYS